jgi:hypothetical protein
MELLLRCAEEALEETVAKARFAAGRLHGLDAFDRIELIAAIASEHLLEVREERPEKTTGDEHQHDVDRNEPQIREQKLVRVKRHQGERDDDLHDRERSIEAHGDDELADLTHTVESALDVARTSRAEVPARQREQPPGQVIERGCIDPNGDEREQVAPQDRREDEEDERGGHREDDAAQRVGCPIDDDAIDDDLREHRKEHRQSRADDREPEREAEHALVRRDDAQEPAQAAFRLGRGEERIREIEERGVPVPPRVKLRDCDLARAASRVGDLRLVSVDGDEHDPVTIVPVKDRRGRHLGDVAPRDANGAGGEPDLGRGTTQVAKARPIGRGSRELP